MPFHKAVAVARRLALHDVVGRMETRAISGSVEKLFYQGRPTFVEDETLAHLTDEDLVTFGIPDRYLRDEHLTEKARDALAAADPYRKGFDAFKAELVATEEAVLPKDQAAE